MNVEFSVYRTETHLQNNQQVTGEPFLVFKNGTVKTNTYFQASMYGYFLIYVRAEEKKGVGELPFSANATLRVSRFLCLCSNLSILLTTILSNCSF